MMAGRNGGEAARELRHKKRFRGATSYPVWGDITHDATLFTIMQKYIRQVKFGKKPQDIGYSYKFDDLFEHRYFELYSLHLCE